MGVPSPTASEKLQIAFELAELAQQMMLLNLRRRHPDESEAQVQQRLAQWMRTRPGAEFGDCEGRPVAWPRRSP